MMPVMIEGTSGAALTGPLLDAVLEASTMPMVAWDLDGGVLASNAAFRDFMGYSTDAVTRLQRTALFHPDDRHAVEARMQRRREDHRDSEVFNGRIWTANKRIVRVSCRSTPVVDDGRVVGDVVTCEPTEVSLGDALERQAEQYLALFERISDAVYILDDRGIVSWMNRSAERLFGRTMEVLRNTPRHEILTPEAARGQDNLRQAFSSGESVPDEIRFRIKRPDGEARSVRGSLLMLRDMHGRHTRSIIIARDVTEERRRERELREAALRSEQEAKIDPLTGLGNRRAFDEAMEGAAAQAATGMQVSLIMMDVDRLKAINDAQGHALGDEALRAVAQSLTSRIRGNDQAFHLSGDEFAVIAVGGDATVLAERLRAPIHFNEREPWLTVSVGLASFDEGEDVFGLADARMYEMKHNQREMKRPSSTGEPSEGDEAADD